MNNKPEIDPTEQAESGGELGDVAFAYPFVAAATILIYTGVLIIITGQTVDKNGDLSFVLVWLLIGFFPSYAVAKYLNNALWISKKK